MVFTVKNVYLLYKSTQIVEKQAICQIDYLCIVIKSDIIIIWLFFVLQKIQWTQINRNPKNLMHHFTILKFKLNKSFYKQQTSQLNI